MAVDSAAWGGQNGYPRSDPPDDRELTLAFQCGDTAAYETIYQSYLPRVQSVCRRMLGQHEDAQEATQETFLRVYQALGRFNGRYQLGAWITRIATNVCLDHLRARSRKPQFDVPQEILDLEPSEVEGTIDPELVHLRAADGRKVRRLLANLSPMHRAVIVLREFEGLSYEEIGVALGVTDVQVKALLHRARRSFKKSWLQTIASLLVPARLLPRFKRFDPSLKDQASTTSASQASEIVTSVAHGAAGCSSALQQCGQFVAEKMAPVFTAAVVGGATVGAVLAPSSAPDASQAQSSETELDGELQPSPLDVLTTPQSATSRDGQRERAAAGDPDATAPQSDADEAPVAPEDEDPSPPAPQNSPSPQPTPAPGGGQGSKDGSGAPAPVPPEPQGYTFSFDVDRPASAEPCDCMSPTSVRYEHASATKSGIESFEQHLTGSASAGGTPMYGLGLEQTGSHDTHTARFYLHSSGGGSTLYRADGFMQRAAPLEWGGWSYTYMGSFEFVSSSNRDGMPERGTYVAQVAVSWRTNRVVSSNFSLTVRR